ncbi:MAG: DUF3592 domain-containing protein [Candidatus Kapaibacterium sp.]
MNFKPVIIIIGIIGLFLFLLPDVGTFEKFLAQRNWVRMYATVENISIIPEEVTNAKKTFRTVVHYSYSYQGHSYRGADVQNFSEVYPSHDTEENVQRYKFQKYPLRSALGIALNPLLPSNSTVPEFHRSGVISFLLGCAIVFFSVVMFFALGKRRDKS